MAGNFSNSSKDHNSRLPSTTSTEETTSSYPTDRTTGKPHDPKGMEYWEKSEDFNSGGTDVGRLGPMGRSG